MPLETLIELVIFTALALWIAGRLFPGAGHVMAAVTGGVWFLLVKVTAMSWQGLAWVWSLVVQSSPSGAALMGRWARWRLTKRSHKGLILDGDASRLSIQDSCRNCAVVATTGAGKTSSFILPNLYGLDDCSIVVTDPSGALYEKASGDLAARGFEVLRFDPLNLSHSVRYNPLAYATRHSSAGEIAQVLVATGLPGGGADPFWNSGAEEILTVLIRCLLAGDPAHRNLANLHMLLQCFGDGRPLFDYVSQHADNATFQQFQGFISQAPNTMQGLLSSAKVALKAVADPDIAALTATNTLDFGQFRKRKTALFLVLPQNRLSYYSFLASLLYSQFFHYALDDYQFGRDSLPMYALLDEFGHLRLPNFPEIITTTRARRISISIVLQALSQLEERYGKAAANTILHGGIASKIFFSGMDTPTAEMLARTVGSRRVEVRDSDNRLHVTQEPLLSAAELRTLPDNQALYLFANKPATLLSMHPYYDQWALRKRSELPPYSPPVNPVAAPTFLQL